MMPQESILYASVLQSSLQVNHLPVNIAQEQQENILRRYKHCTAMQAQVQKMYVCLTCILKGNTNPPKMRLALPKEQLQCNVCQNDFSIVEINMLGAVVHLAGTSIVMCLGCNNFTANRGDGTILSGLCKHCEVPQKAAQGKNCFPLFVVFCMLPLLYAIILYFVTTTKKLN